MSGTGFMMNGLDAMNIPKFDNVAINNAATAYNPGESKVDLFLFAPRKIVNTFKRPHSYNFQYNFIEDVSQCISATLHAPDSSIQQASMMNGFNSAIESVIPADNGLFINNRYFEELWTFILIMNNIQLDSAGVYLGPRLNNRRIGFGVCYDEPCVKQNGIGLVMNPNCMYKFTHMTQFTFGNRYINGTQSVQHLRNTADIDYVAPDMCAMLNPDLTEFIRPQDLQESIVPNIGGSILVSDHNSIEHKGLQPVAINSSLASPKMHMKNIVTGLMRSVEDQVNNDLFSTKFSQTESPIYGGVDTIANACKSYVTDMVPNDNIAVDGSRIYTYADFVSMFPSINVCSSAGTSDTIGELADQSTVTRSNKGSDIVCTTMPALMSDCGLAELAFRYSSYRPGSFINDGSDNFVVKIENVAPWHNELPQVTTQRVNSLIGKFNMQLAPMLKALGGEFELMCSYSSGGLCDVLLYYLDDRQNTCGIYESPLFLGGFNSPLIASRDHKINNGQHYAALIQGVSANLTGGSFSSVMSESVESMLGTMSQQPNMNQTFADDLFSRN